MKERETALINETYNLTSQVAQQMQKRVDSIKNFVKPVTDFTQAAGRKIGDMIFNMQSEEATWEELWKNMALAVGEAVIEMGAQYMQNFIMQQSINRASESEAISDATVKTTAGIAAGSAKTIGELGWWGIPLVAVISALLMGLLQAALSTNRDSGSNANAAKPKIKLASGMLTYDEGNVQTVEFHLCFEITFGIIVFHLSPMDAVLYAQDFRIVGNLIKSELFRNSLPDTRIL